MCNPKLQSFPTIYRDNIGHLIKYKNIGLNIKSNYVFKFLIASTSVAIASNVQFCCICQCIIYIYSNETKIYALQGYVTEIYNHIRQEIMGPVGAQLNLNLEVKKRTSLFNKKVGSLSIQNILKHKTCIISFNIKLMLTFRLKTFGVWRKKEL